ncbi:hypothetical protein ACFE04_022456 [Oxalis oulophora]
MDASIGSVPAVGLLAAVASDDFVAAAYSVATFDPITSDAAFAADASNSSFYFFLQVLTLCPAMKQYLSHMTRPIRDAFVLVPSSPCSGYLFFRGLLSFVLGGGAKSSLSDEPGQSSLHRIEHGRSASDVIGSTVASESAVATKSSDATATTRPTAGTEPIDASILVGPTTINPNKRKRSKTTKFPNRNLRLVFPSTHAQRKMLFSTLRKSRHATQ